MFPDDCFSCDNDHPIMLSSDLARGLSVCYILAPQIEKEEDPMEWIS